MQNTIFERHVKKYAKLVVVVERTEPDAFFMPFCKQTINARKMNHKMQRGPLE
jgi:hypothetical protein